MIATRLKVDHLYTPLGLGNTSPGFSWNAEGGAAQTAYRLIARCEGHVLWDTGRVYSARMTNIRYGGLPLCSRQRVDWSVTLWDESGIAGETVESRFEIGLLDASDWSARWISGSYKPNKKKRYPVDCFRKSFALRGGIRAARLYASARGVYDVTINGHRVEDFILAPGMTDYRKRIQYQTYDVTSLLKAENTVELRLADGWYRGSVAAYGVTNVFGMQTSVIGQLEISYRDGSTQIVVTDGTWAWSNDGALRFADLKDGEMVDASMKPSYQGKAIEIPAPKDARLTASDNVPVREHERLTPTFLPSNVLDFGQNIAGYLQFTVQGKKGQTLRFVMGEVLDDNGNVDLRGIQESRPQKGWSQLSLIKKLLMGKVSGEINPTPRQEIVFTCSGDEGEYKTSFSVFGFRYAQIIGDIQVDPRDFTAIAVYSDMEQTGRFSCSNELINKLVSNTRWSMKGNFLDVPTDCPTRERLGWTGDAQVFFDTGAYLMDTAAFFAKWLRDMEDAVYLNGLLPAVLPFSGIEMMYRTTGSSVGWADAIYLIPWRHYLRYGDESLLRRCFPMIRKYADYLMTHTGLRDKKADKANPHNIYTYEKGVHLGEWLEPEEFRDKVYGTKAKHPEECTAYLFYAMTTIAQIAQTLGKSSEAYERFAKGAKEVYHALFIETGEWDTDRQAKIVRPLALGLVDGEDKTKLQKRLKQAVERYRYRVGTGFLSTPFLLPVLTEAGYVDTAYAVLENTEKPGWLGEVLDGATTIWENWEGNLSQNHYAPGAVCQWLFDTAAGIRMQGERHFLLAPIPGGTLSYAEAAYVSPYGKIISRWSREDGKTRFDFTVPANTTADIRLPDGTQKTVSAGEYSFIV